jgi:hypothetical protein
MGKSFDFAMFHQSSSVGVKLDALAVSASLRESDIAVDIVNLHRAVAADVGAVRFASIPDQIVPPGNLASRIFLWWIHASVCQFSGTYGISVSSSSTWLRVSPRRQTASSADVAAGGAESRYRNSANRSSLLESAMSSPGRGVSRTSPQDGATSPENITPSDLFCKGNIPEGAPTIPAGAAERRVLMILKAQPSGYGRSSSAADARTPLGFERFQFAIPDVGGFQTAGQVHCAAPVKVRLRLLLFRPVWRACSLTSLPRFVTL